MGKWINADYIKAVMKGDRLMQGNCEYELWKQEVDKKVDAMPSIEVMDVVTAYQQGWCDALDASIVALNDAKFQLAKADRKTETADGKRGRVMIEITFDEIGKHIEQGDIKEWLAELKVLNATKGMLADDRKIEQTEREVN